MFHLLGVEDYSQKLPHIRIRSRTVRAAVPETDRQLTERLKLRIFELRQRLPVFDNINPR